VLAPLTPSTRLSATELADRAIRQIAPAILERLGAPVAAERIRTLPPLTGSETARAAMPALERIARSTMAPPGPIRSASQCAGAVLRLEMPGGEEPGTTQLVAAVTRLVNAAVKAGVPATDAVRTLAG